VFKANAIVDARIIRALYRASQAGVKVDLIVRSICCLRPGLPDVSENIRVLSVVGRFLEHSRIYYFHNLGEPSLYVGSADLMPRNIDRRVEVLFPIEDSQLVREIKEHVLDISLQDTEKGHWLQPDGRYLPAAATAEDGEPLFNSQEWLLNSRVTLQQPFPGVS
jgi:polyphosphate kinase